MIVEKVVEKVVTGVAVGLITLVVGKVINEKLIQKNILKGIGKEKIPSKTAKATVKKIIEDGDVAVIVDLYDSKGFITKKNVKIEGRKVSNKIKVGTIIKIKEE